MDENQFLSQLLLIPGLIIIGGFAVLVTAILRRGKLAELQHRERMAMIERGMTPPSAPLLVDTSGRRSHGARMTLGIILCGLGLAFVLLIAFAAGEPGVATGVGGAIFVLGLAFVVSATVNKGEAMDDARGRRPFPPPFERRDAPPPSAEE